MLSNSFRCCGFDDVANTASSVVYIEFVESTGQKVSAQRLFSELSHSTYAIEILPVS